MYRDLKQGSPEWFEARKKFKITMSNAGAAIGVGRFKSRNQVLQEKRNPQHKDLSPITAAILESGVVSEEYARESAEEFLGGITIHEEGLNDNPDYPGVAGSHDGIWHEASTIFEFKKRVRPPNSDKAPTLPTKPYPEHVVQCVGNIEMRGVARCLLVYYLCKDDDHTTVTDMVMFPIAKNTDLWNHLIWPRLQFFISYLDSGDDIPRLANGEKEIIIKRMDYYLDKNQLLF